MKKLYLYFAAILSTGVYSQSILNQAETGSRTVSDPQAVVLAQGFHASSNVSNPFIAKIGASTDAPTNPTNSDAGSTNPSGTTAPTGMSFHDTQGSIDVNGGGQLQYTLPIALPPGVKSVAPQIDLVYTSGSGNGIAGYGWNISGVTAITRMGKTIENDGEVKGIQLDYSDYYSFNGQRLILKSGEYGKDGAEYVTEKYSNIKIKSKGEINQNYSSYKGPAFWEITFEDGSTAEYGLYIPYGTPSMYNATTPMEYNIRRWRDAQGNTIIYNYKQNAGNVTVISSIEWGGNDILLKSHFNEIIFIYKMRDLKEQSYVAGIAFQQNQLLSDIIVNSNGNLFKKYEISYVKNNTNYDFIDTITEKNSQNQPANPVIFDYQRDNFVLPNTFAQNTRFDDLYGADIISGDFNGDGKLDFIKENTLMFGRLDGTGQFVNVTYQGQIYGTGYSKKNNIFLNKSLIYTSEGIFSQKKIIFRTYEFLNNTLQLIKQNEISIADYPELFSDEDYINYGNMYGGRLLCYYENGVKMCFVAKEDKIKVSQYKVKEGSFSGDGTSKFLFNIYHVYYGSSVGQTDVSPDTDIFGRKEVFYFDPENLILVKQNIKEIENYQTGDFDGDGKSDLLKIENNNLNVYSLNNQNQFVQTFSTIKESLEDKMYLGDFNGDGKTDILAPIANNSSDWRMYISTGKGFRKEYYSNLFLYYPAPDVGPGRKFRNIKRTYSASDLNKDGKSDIIIFESQVWYRDCATCWNDPDSSYGFNYLRNEGVDSNGKPIFSNVYNIAPKELDWDGEDINYSMYGEHYIPLFGNFRISNLNTEFAIIHKTKLITWNLGNKLNNISKIKAITQGGVKTEIQYEPLTQTGNIYKSYQDINPVQYPFVNIAENINYSVVSRLIQGERKQDFRYRDMIGHLQGKGLIGFRQTARSTFYTDEYINTQIWSGSQINPLSESLIDKEWSIKTSNETSIFPTDISIDNTQLLTFKEYHSNIIKLLNGSVITNFSNTDKPKIVTAINPYMTISKDFQKDTKIVHIIESYDDLYLPTKSKTILNDGFAITTSEVEYFPHSTQAGNYSIGKPKSKKETIEAYGDTKTSKEEYVLYIGNLLKIKKSYNRDNTGFIQEDYAHDGFGNIIQKTIGSSNNNDDVEEQTIQSLYDDKGRFVIKKIDNLGLETEITYNNWGQVESQKDTFGNILTNTYDYWGKLLTSKTNLGGITSYTYEKLSNGDTKIIEFLPNNDQNITYTSKHGQQYKKTTKAFAQNTFISSNTKYDALGRKTGESNAYFEGSSPSKWSSIKYDDYSRPIEDISSFGRKTVITYGIREVKATETNANNRFKIKKYDPFGNLVSVTDKGGTVEYSYNAAGENLETKYGNNIVKTNYDNWGHKSYFYDPSNSIDEQRAYRYEYNGYGQIIKEISPKGNKQYIYNQKGQLIQQKELSNDGTFTNKNITYSYNSKGLVTSKTGTVNGKAYSTIVNYDDYGRIISASENSNGRYFMKKGITYDNMMRVVSYEKSLYSNGQYTKALVENIYSYWSGELSQVRDKTRNKVLWMLQASNANGQVVNATLGNTYIENQYDGNNFLYTTAHKNITNSNTVLQMTYNFDALKNELKSRTRGGDFNIAEAFEYDDNNRLKNWTEPVTGAFTQNGIRNTYDIKGRIINNDQVGEFKFDNTNKVYQPTRMVLNTEGQQNYSGNLLQKITYNENNDPIFIDGMKGDVVFNYGLTNMRQTATYGGNFGKDGTGKYTKYYSEDGSYEIVRNNQTGQEKHILYIGGTPYDSNIIYLKDYTESNGSYKFLHKDYLGSILAISDEAGNAIEQRHYDAWGQFTHLKVGSQAMIVGVQQVTDYLANNSLLLDRGYTSHEHFSEVGLIHMNGRLYDPLLRRFLNADENIQDPENTQNYNKYAYVLNNPLMHNDFSGEVMGWDDALIAIGIAIFTSVATDYYLNRPVNILSMFQSMVMAMMSAGIANGIGDVFKASGTIAQSLGKTGTLIARAGAHAVAQGTLSYVQGGHFLSGALSGAFASIAGDLLKLAPKNSIIRTPIARFLTGAIVGGIGSELTGGNFWQGAAIGAVVAVFNHMNHEEPPTDFNENYYFDPETGYSYYKKSEYLYEVRDQNGKIIQEKYISQVAVKFKNADIRQQLSGFKAVANVMLGVGFFMTATGVAAPLGIAIMGLAGGISTTIAVINTLSYVEEKRYKKAIWEGTGEAVSYLTGKLSTKLISPNADLFKGNNQELGEQVASFIMGEAGVPLIEQSTKIY